MITVAKIDLAIAEAERFIRAARAAKKRLSEDKDLLSSVETGTARRASMDLTRALATLRKKEVQHAQDESQPTSENGLGVGSSLGQGIQGSGEGNCGRT